MNIRDLKLDSSPPPPPTSINLNIKHNLLYTRKTPSTTVIKTNQLMMYKAKVAACSTKHPTQNEHHVEFFNIKSGGTYRNR
jgi:hypothetical protein